MNRKICFLFFATIMMGCHFLGCGSDPHWGNLPIGVEVHDQTQKDAISFYNEYFKENIFTEGNDVSIVIVKNDADKCLEYSVAKTHIEYGLDDVIKKAKICIDDGVLRSNQNYYYEVMIHELAHSLGMLGHGNKRKTLMYRAVETFPAKESYDDVLEEVERDSFFNEWMKENYNFVHLSK